MPERSRPRCSIVIRSYNEERQIGKLLHGIGQQTIKNVETIVVDSGSTDATAAIAGRYQAKLLNVDPENFSFGHSLNIGCQDAAADFVVIASAHVYPIYTDWLEQLLAPFKDSQIALVYGKQRGGKTTKYSEHHVFAKWFGDTSNPGQNNPFCNNANAAIRRKIWKQLPYNDELTGLEDIDWANRAIQLGYRIAYEAGAEVVHVHNETYRQIFNRYRREAIAMKRIFPDEHFYFGDFIRLFFENVANDYTHAWREGVLRRELFGIPYFRLMQFWGTYRGFAQRGPVTSQLKETFYYPNRIQGQAKMSLRAQENSRPLVDYSNEKRLYRENL